MRFIKMLTLGIALLLILNGCSTKEQDHMGKNETKTVTFINGAETADLWILADTEENRKTSLWGTATAAKVKTGEKRAVPLCAPGDGERYLLRMIDTDHGYYAADGVLLRENWTLEIRITDLQATLEVFDENGVPQKNYEVFWASL